jgi:predicted DNA-binding helix-hairpin-helix protein
MITPTPRRKVNPNSSKVYHEEIKGTKEDNQDQIILKAVKTCQPCTYRQIQAVTNMEVNVLSRSLNNCKKKQLLEVYFSANCPITGRKASHYVEKGYSPDQRKP